MTTASRLLGLLLLVLVVAVAVLVLTDGHPASLVGDLADLRHQLGL